MVEFFNFQPGLFVGEFLTHGDAALAQPEEEFVVRNFQLPAIEALTVPKEHDIVLGKQSFCNANYISGNGLRAFPCDASDLLKGGVLSIVKFQHETVLGFQQVESYQDIIDLLLKQIFSHILLRNAFNEVTHTSFLPNVSEPLCFLFT